MVSRASHYSAKARHSQREFGAEKPKMVARDTGTAWIPKAVEALQAMPVGEYFNINQINHLFNISSAQLRELSRRGILHMRGRRSDSDEFIEFQWALQTKLP